MELVKLAEEINTQHKACEMAATAAVRHAINAGELLVKAKEGVPHGEWGTWLAENFEGSVRTAQVYMRLYRKRDELPNAQDAAHLSLEEAQKTLSAPETPAQLKNKAAKEEQEKAQEEAERSREHHRVYVGAVAEANGVAPNDVDYHPHHYGDVDRVRESVEKEAVRRALEGKTFTEEERAKWAYDMAHARVVEARSRAEGKAMGERWGMHVLDPSVDLQKARQNLNKAYKAIRDADTPYTDDEKEILHDDISKVREALDLLSGAFDDIDWDAELGKLNEADNPVEE